jgi:flavin-dependent thymidylate synthase
MSNTDPTWVDQQQFYAQAMPEGLTVRLITATPYPLNAVARAAMLYEGKLHDPTPEDQQQYFHETMKTHLKAPLEFVHMMFLIEGITRALTHQMVRQRTAVYVQESLRFAVKNPDELTTERGTEVPPSIAELPKGDFRRQLYFETINITAENYAQLIANGIPAEDARHLLPHATKTRIIYGTDLRHFIDTLGNRLCTQAQYQWRELAAAMIDALLKQAPLHDAWAWRIITDRIKPICFAAGKCPFHASFDRNCTIRERMDSGRAHEVRTEEWMYDPAAARK